MFKKILLLISIASLCLLFVVLNTTIPTSAGPVGVLSVFVFAYMSSLGAVTYFLFGISKVVSYLSVAVVSRKPIEPLSFKRSYYYSTVIAAAPVLLLALQSVGAIGIYESLLVMIFVLIGCLYVSKRVD